MLTKCLYKYISSKSEILVSVISPDFLKIYYTIFKYFRSISFNKGVGEGKSDNIMVGPDFYLRCRKEIHCNIDIGYGMVLCILNPQNLVKRF